MFGQPSEVTIAIEQHPLSQFSNTSVPAAASAGSGYTDSSKFIKASVPAAETATDCTDSSKFIRASLPAADSASNDNQTAVPQHQSGYSNSSQFIRPAVPDSQAAVTPNSGYTDSSKLIRRAASDSMENPSHLPPQSIQFNNNPEESVVKNGHIRMNDITSHKPSPI